MAHVFGTISPKMSTNKVSIPVAIPTAAFPHTFITKEVIREDALMFTILLPIRMALINLLLLSSTLCSLSILLVGDSSTIERTLMTLIVVMAVSAEEKKADRNNRIIRVQSCMTPVVSKI